MPRYQVTLQDGRKLEVEADTPEAADMAAGEYVRAKPAPKKVSAGADAGNSFLSGLRSGAAGLADIVQQASPLGGTLTALQGAANVAGVMRGQAPRTLNLFSENAQGAAKIAYAPQTRAGKYARAVGENIPNVIAPGGPVRKAVNVFAPALMGEGAGQLAEEAGAGEGGQTAARIGGALTGASLASVNPINLFRQKDAAERAASVAIKRGRVDPASIRTDAERLRAAGIDPTLTDVAGERGRRLIRAVGVKNQDVGERLVDRARSVGSTAKPAVMDRTAQLGPNRGETSADLESGLRTARDEAASTAYRAPYQTPVQLTDDTLRALNDEPGRAALRRAKAAAVARMDERQIAEIDALLKMNPPPTEVTAGTLDRVRIAMRGRAEKMAQSPDTRDIASGLRPRVGMIDDTLGQVPALGPARADFKAKTQAIDVLGKGRRDVFSTSPQDYAAWLKSLPPEAVDANKVAIRQEIMDTLGGQRSSAFGTVDELVTSEYARANLQHALGPEAGPFLANLEARLGQVRNARFVSPNDGSRTAVLENDLSGLMNAGGAVRDTLTGNIAGLASRAAQWFASRGIGDDEARVLADAATDPARLNQLIGHIEQRYGRKAAQEFLSWRQALLPAALATSGAQSRGEPQQAR